MASFQICTLSCAIPKMNVYLCIYDEQRIVLVTARHVQQRCWILICIKKHDKKINPTKSGRTEIECTCFGYKSVLFCHFRLRRKSNVLRNLTSFSIFNAAITAKVRHQHVSSNTISLLRMRMMPFNININSISHPLVIETRGSKMSFTLSFSDLS